MSTSFGKSGFRAASASADGVTVLFGEHFAHSGQFDAIFKEGMALVERTAAYLDGPGRTESKALAAPSTMVYATESMRLTTRLLELASWLMLHRALKDGEIDSTQAAARRQRVKLAPIGRPAHVKGFDALPSGLRELVQHSFALNDRINRIDHAMVTGAEAPVPQDNMVGAQVARLEAAFGGMGRSATS